MQYGTTELELFRSIAEGTGVTMPGFIQAFDSEDTVWDLIRYLQSFWGEDWQAQ